MSCPSASPPEAPGIFAAGAVSLLDKLGCVNSLCFGSESGDISLFEKTATLLQCESAAFSDALKKALKSGLSFLPHASRRCFYASIWQKICHQQLAPTTIPQQNRLLPYFLPPTTFWDWNTPWRCCGETAPFARSRSRALAAAITIRSAVQQTFLCIRALRSLLAKQGKQALLAQLQCYPKLQPPAASLGGSFIAERVFIL